MGADNRSKGSATAASGEADAPCALMVRRSPTKVSSVASRKGIRPDCQPPITHLSMAQAHPARKALKEEHLPEPAVQQRNNGDEHASCPEVKPRSYSTKNQAKPTNINGLMAT